MKFYIVYPMEAESMLQISRQHWLSTTYLSLHSKEILPPYSLILKSSLAT